MHFKLKTTQKLTYRLELTAQMKLAINLLQMPLAKLKEFATGQAEINPLLEIETDTGQKLESDYPIPEDIPSERKNHNLDNEEKQVYLENIISTPASLQEHLLMQLRLISNSEKDYKIGELIIGHLDNNGYFRHSTEEIAKATQSKLSQVEKILLLIQTFDPIGVGAKNLRECLLLQIKAKPLLNNSQALAYLIIDKYLIYLEKKKYKCIVKKLSAEGKMVSQEEFRKALDTIANLEPKPGRLFDTETAVRLIPDAFLRKNKKKYEVIFNNRELPQLTINNRYKQLLKQKDTPRETKEYLKERLKAAHFLIDAVKKRKETIQRIMEEVIYLQNDFLNHGESNFKPLILEQVAKRIGKHKSTVSRAIANKYIQTPWGILELRYFLSSGIKQENGQFLSSKAIKSKIKDLIENENEPLTDQKITHYFKQKRISVSRRTITKYRAQLKILSSKSRRN